MSLTLEQRAEALATAFEGLNAFTNCGPFLRRVLLKNFREVEAEAREQAILETVLAEPDAKADMATYGWADSLVGERVPVDHEALP